MITVRVKMGDLSDLQKALEEDKNKAKIILRGAINDTAKQTVKVLGEEASKQYYFRANAVKKTIKVKKATVRTLSAIIESTGRANELYNYKVLPRAYRPKNRPKLGHKGNVKRSNNAKYIYRKPEATDDKYKAFTIRFKSGHVTIAQRIPGKKMKGKPDKEAIKTLYSPSIPTILGYEKGVYGIVKPYIENNLHLNIQNRIMKQWGGKK